jgi:hypothetical protein
MRHQSANILKMHSSSSQRISNKSRQVALLLITRTDELIANKVLMLYHLCKRHSKLLWQHPSSQSGGILKGAWQFGHFAKILS